jgi:hypothetical protein
VCCSVVLCYSVVRCACGSDAVLCCVLQFCFVVCLWVLMLSYVYK